MGRNELCSCGSGKKFKRCCGAVDLEAEDTASRFFGVAAVLTAVMLVGGIVVFARAFLSEEPGRKAWSTEQGRYHTVGGGAPAGDAPGRVWDPKHGHYHDAAKAGPPPLQGQAPIPGALEGLRAAEMEAARQKLPPPAAAK